MNRLHLLAQMCILLVTGLSIPGCNKPKTDTAPQVVIYCSADQEFAEKVLARFTEKTGITVLARYDVEATKTLGLVQRLRSEASNPQADVFWSSEIFETIRLADEYVLTACSPEITKSWPKQYADPQGRWYGFALRARVLACNTRLVIPAEMPRSIEDLLDPKWKNQLIMARPQFGTTRGHVAAIYVHYGPKRAEEIFKGLAQNNIRIVNGNSTAARLVAEGQAKVCLTDTDDVWVAKRNGWPLDLVYPKHEKAGTLVIPNTAAMVRGAPHPAQAAALIDFLLSDEVATMLAKSDSHNVPVQPELGDKFPQYKIPDPMTVDYAKVKEAVNPAVHMATKILEHKK